MKSVSSFISCWLWLQHSFCTCTRMSFLMLSSLDSEDRRGLGVKECTKKKGYYESDVGPEWEREGEDR